MATYALIHGAGGGGWYWHLLEAELRGRGHDVVAPDLPSDDAAGLPKYADTVVEAVGDRTGLVVVAQSYGGFTAPLVCDRLPADDVFFPADFLRRVVQDRLAITPDEIDGGHCVALSRPRELADRLESFRVGL
jgi:pimeloyl-ACP methyl ester carboxylesterase